MQYLVSEIIGKVSQQAGYESRVFQNISDTLKYLSKIDRNQKLVIEKEEVSLDRLTALLAEKLSTVSIQGSLHPEIKYIITAF